LRLHSNQPTKTLTRTHTHKNITQHNSVEARNALSKLEYLYSLTSLSRADLPWGHAAADADRSAIWEEPPSSAALGGAVGGE
jgi:hypothetical protein